MSRIAFLALFGLAATSGFAQIIYDNGGPNQTNGDEMSGYLEAEDFVLNTGATLLDIHFWTLETPNTAYDGTVQWWVFNDNGGLPGGILATGVVNGPSKTFLQGGLLGSNNFNEYRYDMNVAGPGLLANTAYFLGLHVNTTRNWFYYDSIYWETTNANGTPFSHSSLGGTMNNWANNGQELAFNLTSVPEPVSLIAMGLGFAALAARRRRK